MIGTKIAEKITSVFKKKFLRKSNNNNDDDVELATHKRYIYHQKKDNKLLMS